MMIKAQLALYKHKANRQWR